MEHAKKYMLVDPQMYRPSLPEKSLSRLDQDIQSTLNGDLPDDQKVKLYMSTLKKYRTQDGNTKQPEPKLNLDNELTDTLPSTQQYKAKKLLRLIRDNPDIDWSDKGELIYKQTLIPESHIADLFGDIIATKRPAEGPAGWEEFDEVLESSKVPSTLAKRRKRVTKRRVRSAKTWIPH